MSKTATVKAPVRRPAKAAGDAAEHDGPWQVILFNDDHTYAGFVVLCLMRVFGHNEQVAQKVMLEAHNRGRAIAEVEEKEKAQLHKDQLQSFGLTAAIEKI
jgi:ATP-dependent Clp protease adaptor protein ClpS